MGLTYMDPFQPPTPGLIGSPAASPKQVVSEMGGGQPIARALIKPQNP